MALNDFYSSLGILAIQDGYTDMVAIVRDTPTEPIYETSISGISPTDVIPVHTMGVNFNQPSYDGKKYAGEGPDPQTFRISQLSTNVSISFPLLTPCYGWVDAPFAHLWHHAMLAYRGTATAAWATIVGVSNTPPSGVSTIPVDNIADFLPYETPFNALIRTGSTDYAVVVQSASKSGGVLGLSAPAVFTINSSSTIRAVPTAVTSFTERGFTLVSMREGVFRPCLVKSLSLTLPAKGDATVQSEIASCRLFRGQHPEIREAYETMAPLMGSLPLSRRIMPASVSIANTASPSWSFGIGTPMDDTFLAGFQGLSLAPMVITEASIKIDNKIQEVNTLHGLTDSTSYRDNQHPIALACESRTISGEISVLSHLRPWALVERLSSPSTAGMSGIEFTVDTFSLNMPLVAWEPSSGSSDVDGYHERKLKWTLIADDYDNPPVLEYPS